MKTAMESPLVSVITATYNNIKYNRIQFLQECIESVHSQEYNNIEHIVIDNASDDGTLDVIRKYEKKGWLRCISEADSGIYDAFNKGIKHAKGKYVVFLNSDDYWTDNKGVSRTVYFLESTGADFAYSNHIRVDSQGNTVSRDYPRIGAFFSTMPICHQTMFTKRSVLLEVGGFDTSYTIAADYDQLTRIILSGKKPVYVPMVFTAFRQGGISTNKSTDKISQQERLMMRERIWYPILGKGYSEIMVQSGIVPDDFFRIINPFVHPSVALEVSQCISRVANKLRVTNTFTRYIVAENKTINWGPALNQSSDLLHFLIHFRYGRILCKYYKAKIMCLFLTGSKRDKYKAKAVRLKELIRSKRSADLYFNNSL